MQDTSSKQQTKQNYKPSYQQKGLPPHSALPIRGKTNKQKLSTNLTLYKAYTIHWTNLRRAETKKKKEFNLLKNRIKCSLKPGKGDLKNNKLKKKKKNMKRQRNTTQMKEQTRNIEFQIDEEEIGKLPGKEFRIMMIKMIKNLENKMEKIQESINRHRRTKK